MKKNGIIPNLILCSPAVRARETLEGVNNELGVERIVYEDSIYGASVGTLRGLVDRYSQSCKNFMITGHNPGLDELMLFLCRTNPSLTETGKLMTTAAVAVIGFTDAGNMSKAASGELLHLVRPGELESHHRA